MHPLHYAAHVAPVDVKPLHDQVTAALAPYVRYLMAAKSSAQKRQRRSILRCAPLAAPASADGSAAAPVSPAGPHWIQLLPATEADGAGADADAAEDPRAAWVEGGHEFVEVLGGDFPVRARVLGVRREDLQIALDRAVPEDTRLQLPSRHASLSRQLQAIYQLRDAPLPQHRALLRCCDHPAEVGWPPVPRVEPERWFLLTRPEIAGTETQRDFVRLALGTPDVALLEGPPGSGKTHAICELVLQLVVRGQRVLLCSTTNAAVDNVLERLGDHPLVSALRLGPAGRVDEGVRSMHLESRADALARSWRGSPAFAGLDPTACREAALEALLDGANVVASTVASVAHHPHLRGGRQGGGPPKPRFDTLILDEASRTTWGELLIPALLAERLVIVGDVRQLSPFSEREDMEAALAALDDTGTFGDAEQRALWTLLRVERHAVAEVRWLVVASAAMLRALARYAGERDQGECFWLDRRALSKLEAGQVGVGVTLQAARFVLVAPADLEDARPFLAPDLQPLAPDPDGDRARESWAAREPHEPARAAAVAKDLAERTWAEEVGWRLQRVHTLQGARWSQAREARAAEVRALLPPGPVGDRLAQGAAEVVQVGLRSVIEVLQCGGTPFARAPSMLSAGLPPEARADRFVRLAYQHRMHPQISAFPREIFYDGSALHDGDLLATREAACGYGWRPEQPRRAWDHVIGKVDAGRNAAEAERAAWWLEDFLRWAEAHPRRDGRRWEIALLSFYNAQTNAMRDEARRLTALPRAEQRFRLPHVDLVVGTVDRFQGREADVVLLSLRNTDRNGHLDSTNRLNVALTRARHQLVLIGHRGFFAGQESSAELRRLARDTPIVALTRSL